MLHFHAPENWINDPNGFIFYNQQYHLFSQYFPYGKRWGTMHWRHAVSEDLVCWKDLGIALFPSRPEDQNGVFSGSAIEKDGQLHLFYTGVQYQDFAENNIHKNGPKGFLSWQLALTSPDGYTFDNFDGKKVVVPLSTDPEIYDPQHTRDPKVWKSEHGYTMVLGSTVQKQGRLLFFVSEDLEHWTLKNTFQKEGLGWMFECPDLFEVDGQHVLLFSPEGTGPYGFDKNQAYIALADFDPSDCALDLPKPVEPIDWGMELYAPQSNIDSNGRRTVMIWLRMPSDFAAEKWIGLYTYPRVLNIENGNPKWSVHPNVLKRFSQKAEFGRLDPNAPFRMQTTLKKGETMNAFGLKIGFDGTALYTDRSAIITTPGLSPAAYVPCEGQEVKLDLFGDKYVFELFVNEGQQVLTQYVNGFENAVDSIPSQAVLTTIEEC